MSTEALEKLRELVSKLTDTGKWSGREFRSVVAEIEAEQARLLEPLAQLWVTWDAKAIELKAADAEYHRNEISRLIVCARELEAAIREATKGRE